MIKIGKNVCCGPKNVMLDSITVLFHVQNFVFEAFFIETLILFVLILSTCFEPMVGRHVSSCN